MSKYMDDKDNFLSPKITQNGGHMVMTNVVKPSKIKYFNIDTRFQEEYNNVTKASFTYQLPQRIADVRSIVVRSVELPISFYSFSQNRGNTFFQVGSTNILIPDSQYTTNSIVTQINSKLSSQVSSNLQISIPTNDVTNEYHTVITNNSGASRVIHFDVDVTGNFNKYNLKSTLGWCLGFREPSYTIANGATLVSEGIVDMNNTRYLFLVVDEFRQSNPNSFVSPLSNSLISKNVLARITLSPSTFAFGSVLTANTFNGLLLSDQRVYSGKTDLQKLNIQLVDEWGNIVDMNQIDFSFCLEIEYE
jgi:hypothetical protein